MLTTITGRGGSVTADTAVDSLEWALPAARKLGSASLTILRGSSLLTSGVLEPDGGSLIVVSHPTLGQWTGITLPPADLPDRSGVRVEARAMEALASWRVVSPSRVLRNLTAGAIARFAFADALAGTPIRSGAFVEAPPLIPEYAFTGQALSDVLGDLSERTGQEWQIEGGRFNWTAALGGFAAFVLTVGTDLIDATREPGDDPVGEVVARANNGQTYTARAGEQSASLWRVQVGLSVPTASAATLAATAELELARRRLRGGTLTGRLAPAWWAGLREGDRVQVFHPFGRYTGEWLVGRVIARSWRDGDAYTAVTLALLPPYSDAPVKRLSADRVEPGVPVALPRWGRLWRSPASAAVAREGR